MALGKSLNRASILFVSSFLEEMLNKRDKNKTGICISFFSGLLWGLNVATFKKVVLKVLALYSWKCLLKLAYHS